MLKLKLQYFGHLTWRMDSLEKTLMLGKIEGGRSKGWQDEVVGCHHRLNRHELEKTPGVGDRQGGLACCSPWCCKESDMTEELSWTELKLRGPDVTSKNYSLLPKCVWPMPRCIQERQGVSGCSQYLTEMLLVVITIADCMSRLLITSEHLDWRKILSVITVNSLR